MYYIALVDDHVLLRNGLAGLINSFPNCKVIIEADNGKDFINKLKPTSLPDVVLMDITMPVMDGFATTKWLTVNFPLVKVLALSMLDDETTILKMLQNGAKGYLLKDCEPLELQLAITSVATKGVYHNELMSSKLLESVQKQSAVQPETKPAIQFTPRELELLQQVCTEKSYREIAEAMNISHRTIETYCENLYQKTGVKTRVGLALYAIKNGIVEE